VPPRAPTHEAWAAEATPHAQVWARLSLAARLREEHGVDVAYAGPDAARPFCWTCNECARAARDRPPVPSGRFCYAALAGLLEHLRAVHDTMVY
jgi:hypothetical protein